MTKKQTSQASVGPGATTLQSDGGSKAPPTTAASFPIVGIGASAGGIEVLRQILSNLPADTGMAFVVILHLDPSRPSLVSSVLGGDARMPVVEAANGMQLAPNRVHVIPATADLRVKQGILWLVPRAPPGQLHLPIDRFFQALSEDQPERAIGVVLSGSGSDGTKGLRAIKDRGGITLVQEPASAKFRGMPESALAARVADFHLAPAAIAKELVRLSLHPYLTRGAAEKEGAGWTQPEEERGLLSVLAEVWEHAQLDFSGYKRPTVLRRIARRLALHHLATMGEYAAVLHQDPDETKALAKDILINVTSFFRDPPAFAALKEQVFPALLKAKAEGAPIRIWTPGCSSGEEVYSIAICLFEYFSSQGHHLPVKLFGSDLNEQAIETARAGLYPESELGGVSAERLARFFDRTEGGYSICKRIRDSCVFVKHDLTRDPPFAKLDLISCRNVLIYFDTELQRRVLPLLHYCLNKPGYLFLGSSETVTGFPELFVPVDKGGRIYQKAGDGRRLRYPLAVGPMAEAKLASQAPLERGQPSREAERQADNYLLARYAPAGVVINERLEIIQFRGRTGAFLESPPGQPQLNLIRMVRSGLLGPLHEAIGLVKTRGEAVRKEGLRLQGDDEKACPFGVNLDVVPLPRQLKSEERYFLILFEAATARAATLPPPTSPAPLPVAAAPSDDQVWRLKEELVATRGYLESLIGEHQKATDDLAVANEELLASNEELQSTNEELQGTQEELQSTNEELNTVNDELRSRNQILDQTANDLVNILDTVRIPLIIVDGELRIRRFTPMAREISNLISGDVGRPIGDVKLKVRLDKLTDKIRETLESLSPKEWEIQGDDGRWLRMQIRPYRGTDNRLDGALLSFIDVDGLKRALQAAEFARDYAQSIIETVQTALVVLDEKERIVSANPAFCEKFGSTASALAGVPFFTLSAGAWQVDSMRTAVAQSLTTHAPFHDLEVQIEFPELGKKMVSLSGRPLLWEGGSLALLLAIEDITDRHSHEEERAQLLSSAQQARIEAERANHAKDLFLATLSHELRTPLSTMLASAQLLKRTPNVDPVVIHRASAAIERAVRAQTRLIDDLLDVSRIVSGKLYLDFQAVDLPQVVRSAIDMARAPAEAKGVALEVAVSDTLGPIYGDPARLQQVVANLLGNSIKFTPRGGKIAVGLTATGGYAELRVADNGIGIAAEFMPHLFDRFVQANSEITRTYGGLGLGLAIVRHLVEVHGGQVQAESPGSGQGATFRVLLPFAAQAQPGKASPLHEGTLGCNLDDVRVLLIDDEDDTREALLATLSAFNADVRGVHSADEGLAAVTTFRPHAILCDIAMPGKDGYSFISKLRRLLIEQGGQTPAAALTALAGDPEQKRALSAGFQLHLTKPIDSARLAASVRTLADWPQPLALPRE
jgi:two-component system CheB/CheR fusion protein